MVGVDRTALRRLIGRQDPRAGESARDPFPEIGSCWFWFGFWFVHLWAANRT